LGGPGGGGGPSTEKNSGKHERSKGGRGRLRSQRGIKGTSAMWSLRHEKGKDLGSEVRSVKVKGHKREGANSSQPSGGNRAWGSKNVNVYNHSQSRAKEEHELLRKVEQRGRKERGGGKGE